MPKKTTTAGHQKTWAAPKLQGQTFAFTETLQKMDRDRATKLIQ